MLSKHGKNTIVDFENLFDLLQLDDGINLGSITIAQQNGDTLIKENGNLLATLQNVNAVDITLEDDFITV